MTDSEQRSICNVALCRIKSWGVFGAP